jgi:hypothetical protein
MKPTRLAPRTARATLLTGLTALALLGGTTATSWASTQSPAAAHVALPRGVTVREAGAAATDSTVSCSYSAPIYLEHHATTPLWSYVPGGSNVNLYFDNSGDKTDFCSVALVDPNGGIVGWQFYQKNTDVCLALDASASSIHEGSATACSDQNSYTVWNLIVTSEETYFLYESQYNGQCIYDDTQRPATYTTSGCGTSDQFEWLTQPGQVIIT